LGVRDSVTFSEGFVPVDAIPRLVADAHVGLVPLRISSGTDIMLPTKLLEYVTMGIPCIVPRTGTICRYFDAEMVRFFEADNAESLAEAILELYEAPDLCESLAHAAAERFGRKYVWSEHKKVYTQLVAQLLGGRNEAVRSDLSQRSGSAG